MSNPVNKKHIWDSKEKDEVDITTAGSALKTENLPLYAKRLSEIIRSDQCGLHEIIKNIKRYEAYERTSSGSKITDVFEDLQVAIQGLESKTRKNSSIATCQQTVDRLIKTLVAKLGKYEILTLLDNEVMALLPPEQRGVVVDIASGIGRFIPYFSQRFTSVIQIDFSEGNIRKARELHKDISNVEYITQNIIAVSFDHSKLDFIFGNWILQYLEDHEVETLVSRVYRWLKPGRIAFFREGIRTNFEGYIPPKNENPAHFRSSVEVYDKWFVQAHFNVIKKGNIKTYESIFNNSNQRYWILKKN